ncbi:hypothetical protein [Erythrobacter sp. EC-HK427]|uniref:hypothetical protein n=1 Tax=Erythrobacter sp. EC-HK427 TaxID=2038396 RepID=UPI0012583602|nr:hypothetical protein [Erythrobacter sp. EC-HK427]VVT19046.1 exported hypothetical protein [Erythrobacter sp. EC-HK427]
MKAIAPIIAAAAVLLPVPVAAQKVPPPAYGTPTTNGEYSDFVRALQSALAAGEQDAVIGMIRLPLRVNETSDGPVQTTYIESREDIAARFDWLFDTPLRAAIMAQDPDDVFAPSEGGMIGSGEMWFTATCLDDACETTGPVQIFAINRIATP